MAKHTSVSLKPYRALRVTDGLLELHLIGTGFLYVTGDLKVIQYGLGNTSAFYVHPLEIPGIILDAYDAGFVVVYVGGRTAQVHDIAGKKIWS